MKKIEIIENFGRYKRGHVVEMDDFDTGHALAFKYGKLYAGKPVEVQAVVQPDTREVDHVHEAITEVETEVKPTFFKRRGRKPRA